MTDKRTVFAVMSNDFPDEVFATLELANQYCANRKAEHAAREKAIPYHAFPFIHYSVYTMPVHTEIPRAG